MATVFIVDDEPMLHELYGEILEMGVYEIVANAYNGDEAVEIWSRMDDPPDIIIMDHRMPDKDGVETTKEILKINPNTKITFVSADTAVMNDALNSGVYSFLSKPFAMSDLLAWVEEVVAECRQSDVVRSDSGDL
ncbi:MAG: response regulator [Euryarchaeota archaeon]|nr:response regulator [Euryarchaeota archaeon]